jgi:hypothetical protein
VINIETALRNGKVWPLQNQQTVITSGQQLVPVSPVDVQILPANNLRKFVQITNDEALNANCIVYLSLGGPAAEHIGIRLNFNGGTYRMTRENLFTGAIRGSVAAAGAATIVSIVEGT